MQILACVLLAILSLPFSLCGMWRRMELERCPPEVEYSNIRPIFPTERRRPGLRCLSSPPSLPLSSTATFECSVGGCKRFCFSFFSLLQKVTQSSQKGINVVIIKITTWKTAARYRRRICHPLVGRGRCCCAPPEGLLRFSWSISHN